MRFAVACFLLFGTSLVTACSTRTHGGTISNNFGDGGIVSDASSDSSVWNGGDMYVPNLDASFMGNTVVYAHSANTLYSLDPVTHAVTTIGTFMTAGGMAPPSMTDLAVNQAGEIYTCSASAIYRVDAMTAVTTELAMITIANHVQFNGLTFVPVGVLDSNAEVLVGAASDGSFYRVDTTSGDATLIGHYSSGYGSSGDLVSVAGAGTFATVKMGTMHTTDYLVSVNVNTGVATPIGSGIGFTGVFGLGYWRNKLYGFTSTGQLISIDTATGVGTLISSHTGASKFYGAGVTTVAPILG